MKTIISLLLLAVVNLIHCQENEQMIVFTLQGVLQKLEDISDTLKGYEAIQQKQEEIMDTLKGYEAIQQKQDEIMDTLRGHEELLQRIPDVQEKLELLENNVQEIQSKLDTLEETATRNRDSLIELGQVTNPLVRRNDLEELKQISEAEYDQLHHNHKEMVDKLSDVQQKLEHLQNDTQGLSQEIGQCHRGDDLGHLANVSAEAHQEIKSFHEEMSGIISLAEKDECSEGSLPCGERGICSNTLFSFICSCPSGFTWDGSDCSDIDECFQGRAECNSNAKCTNTLGSYSCSCNPPFEGDGRTCSCPSEGFASNGDICEDLDECSSAEGRDVCVPNAMCENSIGSYSCSCNKPFEGDGRTSCEFPCRSSAKFISGVGCIQRVYEDKSYDDMNDFCQEEGGRMLTNFNQEQLNDVGNTFGLGVLWVGVYDGKWTSDEESLVPEDLWVGGPYRPDPSRRCAMIGWDFSSYSYKLFQVDCLVEGWGFCQFQHQHLPSD